MVLLVRFCSLRCCRYFLGAYPGACEGCPYYIDVSDDDYRAIVLGVEDADDYDVKELML